MSCTWLISGCWRSLGQCPSLYWAVPHQFFLFFLKRARARINSDSNFVLKVAFSAFLLQYQELPIYEKDTQ